MRHRTAERVAKQTKASCHCYFTKKTCDYPLLQAIYDMHLRDIGVILTKANQAITDT